MTDIVPPLMIVAAAALVRADGRVLLQRRPAGGSLAGLWEFPGGKLEPGENPAAALARELAEELAIVVDPADGAPVMFVTGQAGARPLLLLLYLVRRWQGEPVAMEGATLEWVGVAAMPTLPMPPADVPLVAALARHLNDRPG